MVYNPSNSPAVSRYNKRHYRHFQFYISKDRDTDVLQKLEAVRNKKDYVCSLIRADIQEADSMAEQYAQLERIRQITAGTRSSMNGIIQAMQKEQESEYLDRLSTEINELNNVEERLTDVLNALQPVSADERYNVHDIAELFHTDVKGLADVAEISRDHLEAVADGTADMTAEDLYLLWKVSQISPSRIAYKREEQKKGH